MNTTTYFDGSQSVTYHPSGESAMKAAADDLMKENVRSVETRKIGRNDPCPCNSGKKFKHCCISKMPPARI